MNPILNNLWSSVVCGTGSVRADARFLLSSRKLLVTAASEPAFYTAFRLLTRVKKKKKKKGFTAFRLLTHVIIIVVKIESLTRLRPPLNTIKKGRKKKEEESYNAFKPAA